jgi:hypothetical protein
MTLKESDEDLKLMLASLSSRTLTKINKINKIKLYVSCINKCPIQGNIHNAVVITRLLHLHKLLNLTPNIEATICLSDTCGTLLATDLAYILHYFHCCHLLNNKKVNFSLHLHITSEQEAEKLIHQALEYGVREFDVSLLESGGCARVLGENKANPNLSYSLFYTSLANYITEKADCVSINI